MKQEKIINKIKDIDTSQKRVDNANEIFGYKPYSKEYYPVYLSLKILVLPFSVISVAGGVAYVYISMSEYLWASLALLISLLLIGVLEMAKHFLKNISVRKMYISNKLNSIFLLSLALFGASVFLSLSGVKEVYMRLNTKKVDIANDFAVQEDSINMYYEDKLTLIREEKRGYNRMITAWNGSDIAKAIKPLENRQDETEAQRMRAISELDAMKESQVSKAEKRADFDTAFWIVIALVVEVSILVCIWYNYHYNYMAKSESDYIQAIQEQKFTINMNDLHRFAKDIFSYKQKEVASPNILNKQGTPFRFTDEQKPIIGFVNKLNNEQATEQPVPKAKKAAEQSEQRHFSKDEQVLDLIEQGFTYRKIRERTGVSLGAISRIKKNNE